MAPDVTKHLERARRSLEKNKLRDAVSEYQAALDESPTNQEAVQALADLYVRLNEPVRAAHYYGLQFDRHLDAGDANKASALFARFLRGVPQPPERLARYAGLLQKQGRLGEATEQFGAAAERHLEMHQDKEALACLENVARLDSENANRHLALAELAAKLGHAELAARSFMRAGQLSAAANEVDQSLDYFSRAHALAPGDRSVALFFAEAKLRHGDAAEAVDLLDPFSVNESDTAFLALFGEALLRTGQLDRAREAFEGYYRQKQDSFTKLFELAGAYIHAGQDEKGGQILAQTKEWMKIARRENEFAAQIDRMATVYPNSLPLAIVEAQLYEELNRETKYFDALVRLFDLQLDAGNVRAACEALDRLVDIDPYDHRNQTRIAKLEGKADPSFLRSIISRAAKAATITTRPEGFGGAGAVVTEDEAPVSEAARAQQALEDLIVQVEIFLQYSLHSKAVERLERIAELYPGEERKNDRLRTVYERANWWPKGVAPTPAPKVEVVPVPEPPAPMVVSAVPLAPPPAAAPPAAMGFSADTHRDLAEIAEFTRLMYRQATSKEVVSAAAQEIGKYLNVSRCLISLKVGNQGGPLTAEFSGAGIVPAAKPQFAALAGLLTTVSADALGGIELTGQPALRDLKLDTALGVLLVDKETNAPAGGLLVASERPRKWLPNEKFFLQAVGDQLLISATHVRAQSLMRTVAVADEKTGLVSRGAYLDCLLAESSRARSQGTPLSLIILHLDRGGELHRQHGDAAFDKYVEQLARALRTAVRQTDLAVKHTAWSLAFILPDTGLTHAKPLAEKLRLVAATVDTPWNGPALHSSAVVAEVSSHPADDNEDRVTEWINRAETGLDEVRQHGDMLLTLATP